MLTTDCDVKGVKDAICEAISLTLVVLKLVQNEEFEKKKQER